MLKRILRQVVAVVMLAGIVFTARPSYACGPFVLDAVFTFTSHPEFPLEKFARGELGVVQPTYARSYLFVAYRYLSAHELTAAEQKAVLELWHERMSYGYPDFDEAWPKPWLAARQKVSGVGAQPEISIYRHREKPDEYDTYVNCQKDAFENAAATLEARLKQFGPESPEIKAWVLAQDQVFGNCSAGNQVPASAPVEAPALVRADRDYQIAAANFYVGNLDEAQRLFEAIAKDSASPWREQAPYLAARSLLRKASLGPVDSKQQALTGAEKQLREVLVDQKLRASHHAATRLLNLVRLRLHPDEKLHELAHTLSQQNQSAEMKQDLWDYTVLLDQFLGDGEVDTKQKRPFPEAVRTDDLTDWIATFQAASAESADHALERWNKTASMPWLIAALAKADAKHAKTTELLAAAAKIQPQSPAFASVSFQRVRLTTDARQARALLDDVLTKHRDALPVSTLNLLRSQRLRLATNLSEVLTFAQRLPAGYSWNEDESETVADMSEETAVDKSIVGQPLFDIDGAQLLNRRLPVAVLKRAALNDVLPKHLRRDVAQATWIRAAAVLEDNQTAAELVPALKILFPRMRPHLESYLAASQAGEKRFAAIYMWLKFPGLEPVVDSGVGRTSPLEEQDSYRDNWWCGASFMNSAKTATDAESEPEALAPPFAVDRDAASPEFLSAAERRDAQREYARLTAIGAAPNFLCQQVIAWTNTHPADPRVPEALHLAVKSTRYGCTDKETGKWSKAAFDVLHKRYPNSTWAKQTPYWFKD